MTGPHGAGPVKVLVVDDENAAALAHALRTLAPTAQSHVNTAVLGALAYLEKPVEPEALRRQVALAVWGPLGVPTT